MRLPIPSTIRSLWPLFFGLFLIALGASVQSSLLGIRAALEGFNTTVTGLIMSGYFVGFLFGSTQGPKIIKRVGHVRTFGALTALSSISILIHAMFVDPWTWFSMRVFTGLAFSGIYVVSESWLNQAADNSNRGQILSFYMVTMLLGSFSGQFLLNLADPKSFELFGLISVLVSFAAIPILITATPTPVIEHSDAISIRQLLKWAPFGLAGSFFVNMCYAMIFGMGAVYASKIGMTVKEISFFIAAIVFGGLILQWPLGHLSDKVDRRIVITVVASGAAFFAFLCGLYGEKSLNTLLFLSLLFGGFVLPLYALSIALLNDYMRPEKIVAASGTVILVAGIGSTIGPMLVAVVMETVGAQGFFWCLSCICATLSCYGIYRIVFHPYVPEEERHEFSIFAASTVGTVLHAEVEAQETETTLPTDNSDQLVSNDAVDAHSSIANINQAPEGTISRETD